jgi:uncharacterized FAD-dependent dehydrogenase
MTSGLPHDDEACYDAVLVGSGMAGLLAALRLMQRRPSARALIVDAGLALDARQREAASQMGGYGGAGLYLGGRLYLGPATVPVAPPGKAPEGFRFVLRDAPYQALAAEVDALLSDCGARSPVRAAPEGALSDAVARAEAVGLEYVMSYPARLLTAGERELVLRALLHRLQQAGVAFAFSTRIAAVERHAGGFALALAPSGLDTDGQPARTVTARGLVLAPGRYGSEWLVETVRALDGAVRALPTAFGVRVEVPSATYAPLTGINPDPRIQRMIASDALIKTYATCPGGLVLPVRRYGALVASGIPLPPERRGPSTTFAVLVQPGAAGAAGAWRGGETLAARLNAAAPERLVAQRLGDLRARRASSAADLQANDPTPTCRASLAGNLREAYPPAYWPAFEDFLAQLARLAPGVDADSTLLYGPAEERFWYFPTDDQLQTSVPGLFVAGDGAGQSQGIVQAGVAGLLAGEGLARHLAG